MPMLLFVMRILLDSGIVKKCLSKKRSLPETRGFYKNLPVEELGGEKSFEEFRKS
jgi:hypothetical protein